MGYSVKEKHKSKLMQLAEGITAARKTARDLAVEKTNLDRLFVDTFIAAMENVVAPAFDEYAAEMKSAGLNGHRRDVPGVGPHEEQLPGLAFVFAGRPQSAQKAATAPVFKIAPDPKARKAVVSYEPVASSALMLGSVEVSQITTDWVHEQLNEALEKIDD
jgi:hypothetical protein